MIFTEPGRENQQRCRFAGCGVYVQRTPDGSVADGMRAHRITVHGG